MKLVSEIVPGDQENSLSIGVDRDTLDKKKQYVSILCITFCILIGGVVPGDDSVKKGFQAPSEYKVKSVYIYNFAKFTKWPKSSFECDDSPIVLGIYGEDPFGGIIDKAVWNKKVHNRRIEVKRIKILKDAGSCHILFVSSSEKKKIDVILSRIKENSILTVGESEEFNQQGGMINFLIEKKKVKFEINVEAIKKSGLEVSSKVIKLSKNKGKRRKR